jgi:uncharacterized membrane protein
MKKYFFTGFALLLPLAFTIVIIIFLFDFFTTPFIPIVRELLKGYTFPHGLDLFITRLLALILVSMFIFILGVVARWFLIRNVIQTTERIFTRIPILKTVFNISRDVFSALFSNGKIKVFKRPTMVPFPARPNYSIGFVAGEVPPECQSKSSNHLVSVFVPTAPHPISGFLLLVPEKDLSEITMTNEDAVKFLLSCGLIVPEDHEHH